MPTPNKGEKKKDWLARCMADAEQTRSFPKEDQRFAVCNSKWIKEKMKQMNGKSPT